MKIKTKLILLSITLVILVIAIGLIMNQAFNQINRKIEESHYANKMIKDMFDLNVVTYQHLMYHEKRTQQQWLLKYNSLGKLVEKIKGDRPHLQQPVFVSIISDYEVIGDLFSRLQANLAKRKRLIEENRPQVKINITFAVENRLITQILMRAHKVTSDAFEVSNIMQQSITRLQQRTNLILLFSIIGFIVLSICISFFAIKSITVPISMLVKGAEIVGTGNFEHKLSMESKDEIGQLSRAFDRMIGSLKEITASRDELEREMAERKLAEEALSEKTLWLNSMFHALEEAVFIATPNRKLVDVNSAAEKIFGYTKDELYNLSTEVLHVDHEHFLEFGRRLKKEFDKGETASFEFKAKRKNGEIFPTEHNTSLLKKDDGTHLGIVSVLRDITQRKQAEETLRESERMQGVLEMAGAVCHEMNQPLMAIYGYLDLISMNIASDDPLFEKVSKIAEQSDRLGRITQKLMTITKYETKDYLQGKIIDIEKSSKDGFIV